MCGVCVCESVCVCGVSVWRVCVCGVCGIYVEGICVCGVWRVCVCVCVVCVSMLPTPTPLLCSCSRGCEVVVLHLTQHRMACDKPRWESAFIQHLSEDQGASSIWLSRVSRFFLSPC